MLQRALALRDYGHAALLRLTGAAAARCSALTKKVSSASSLGQTLTCCPKGCTQ